MDHPESRDEEGTGGDDDPKYMGTHERQNGDPGRRANDGAAEEKPSASGPKATATLDEDPDA